MTLKKLMSILSMLGIYLIVADVSLNAVTYKPHPDRPQWRGFYYKEQAYPLLLPTDPYQIMHIYMVFDSITRVVPFHLEDTLNKLSLLSDTAQYIYKYWYLTNEYQPLRFYYFWTTPRYSEAKRSPGAIMSEFCRRMYIDPKFPYVNSSYILHVHINNTDYLDTSSIDTVPRILNKGYGNIVMDTIVDVKRNTEVIAYCKVLEAIKGTIYPSLQDAIYYNGELQPEGTEYSIPNETDIVFSYREGWNMMADGMPSGISILDSNGGQWIKPNREYIVFLRFFPIYGDYYILAPHVLPGFSMYPIENGIVKDKYNALKFGTEVPLNIFKQNIKNIIKEIKEYGD